MKKTMFLIAVFGIFLVFADHTAAQAPSSAYKICANEGQQCSYTGTGRVAFGANGKFEYKNVSRGLACTNAAFGRDPVPGTPKKCYVRLDRADGRITSQPRTNTTPRNNEKNESTNKQDPPNGYIFCANEGQSCNTGDNDLTSIAYGANGKYKYRSIRNAVACNNSVFGDPAPGVSKKCFKFRKAPSNPRGTRSNTAVTVLKGIGGNCLDVEGGKTANGTKVQMWKCHGDVNQRWVQAARGGEIRGIGGKCLTASGTAVVLSSCNNGQSQKWRLVYSQGGQARIVGVGNKCLDVAQSGTANGTAVILYQCTSNPNQKWTFSSFAAN